MTEALPSGFNGNGKGYQRIVLNAAAVISELG
jgi:hypothetical protein